MNPPQALLSEDPRTRSNFIPQFLPLCDLGDAPPADTPNRNDRVRLEFLAVYYELNVASAERLAASSAMDPSEITRLGEKPAELIQRRDRLEDYYTPYGVIAEPTMAHGIALNLTFTFPDESRWYRDEKRNTIPQDAMLQIPISGDSEERPPAELC